jgi:hypothetical protein
MSSLKADFDELRERIRHGRELGHASFEPIYYLVFLPEQILEVKRQTPAWVAKLHQEGWDVHTFSIAEQIWALLKDDPFWSLCVMEDKSAPLDWPRTNKALADILTADNGLLKRLEDALQPLEGSKRAALGDGPRGTAPVSAHRRHRKPAPRQVSCANDFSVPRRANRQDAPEVSRLLPGRRQLPLRPRRRLNRKRTRD